MATPRMTRKITVESKDLGEMERFIKETEDNHLHWEFVGRVVTFIIASQGLITALAWDDTFKHMFAKLFGGLETMEQELLYAILLTFLTITTSVILSRAFLKKHSRKCRSCSKPLS